MECHAYYKICVGSSGIEPHSALGDLITQDVLHFIGKQTSSHAAFDGVLSLMCAPLHGVLQFYVI